MIRRRFWTKRSLSISPTGLFPSLGCLMTMPRKRRSSLTAILMVRARTVAIVKYGWVCTRTLRGGESYVMYSRICSLREMVDAEAICWIDQRPSQSN